MHGDATHEPLKLDQDLPSPFCSAIPDRQAVIAVILSATSSKALPGGFVPARCQLMPAPVCLVPIPEA